MGSLKKRNGRLRKHAMDALDLSMMKNTAANSKTNGKNTGYTHGLRD